MKEPTQVDNSIHAEAMGISIYCTPVPAMSFHLSSRSSCQPVADRKSVRPLWQWYQR